MLSKDKILELWMFHHSPKGINPTGILLLHAFVKPCKDLLGLTILIWKLLWVILPELVIFSMYQTKTFKLAYPLGWSNFSKCSQIEPPFLYSMFIVDTRSHTKFQVSSLNILKWRPLLVNQSWHWRSHLKWLESGTFDLAPFIGIKNALQNGITLGVLDFRKYNKRLVKIAKIKFFFFEWDLP